jgi:uncharacterized protein YcfJ
MRFEESVMNKVNQHPNKYPDNNHNNTVRGAVVLTLLGLSSTVMAATTYEEADVLSTTPIYRVVETTTPQRECWEEEVSRPVRRYSRDNSATPELLGMLLGGALGNAVGHNKTNRRVGTVVGAVLGGSIASDISRQGRVEEEIVIDTVERCRTVSLTEQQEKLVGYDVRYSYNGTERTVRLDRDPGATVKVRVNVEPVL